MDTRKLDVFLKAINAGSLKKAAEKLDYAQSGITYLMNSLENELGVSLLNRSTKGISLTQEGEYVLPYIKKIVDAEAQLMDIIREINEEGIGKVRIGAYPIFACNNLPAAIKSFMNDYPENDIVIRVATNKELPGLLREDEIDIGIGEESLAENMNFIFLRDYQIYAAIPQSYNMKYDKNKPVPVTMFSDYPILLSSYNNYEDYIEKHISNENVCKLYMESADGSALLSMVEGGIGITFLSEMYLRECPDTVDMLPLDPPVFKRLGIIVSRDKMNLAPVKALIPYLKRCSIEQGR